ncbi:MAG: hypothetical protein JW982_12955 [Spirochaetes bacterium]|nr:hypothetical protein [Spirochaetota bacterium]
MKINKNFTIACLMFLLFSILSLTAKDQNPVLFTGKGPENSDPNRSSLEGTIQIYGWSQDGKVFIEENSTYFANYRLIDLITDKVLLSGELFLEPESINKAFDAAKQKYGIKLKSGPIDYFPYTDKFSNEFSAALVNKGTNSYNIEIIKQDSTGKKTKKVISEIVIHVEAPAEIKDTRFIYVKSPYENRLLVVAAVPQWHIEFDYIYYNFFLAGCSLSSRFQ